MKKRILALVISACMIIGMTPLGAIAADHVHDASCGYVEAVPCGHIHDGACGYIAAVEGEGCNHSCGDGSCAYAAEVEGKACEHVHGDCAYAAAVEGKACGHTHGDCAYRESVSGSACGHTHDGACGYAAAVAGTPCGHDCAADGCTDACLHTAHDGACGYSAGTPASACTHSCTSGGSCGYVEAVAGVACDHDCVSGGSCGYVEETAGEPCDHTCVSGGSCGYVEEAAGEPCDHICVSGGSCGYVEETAGEPCTHSCTDGGDCGYVAGSACNYVAPPEHTHSFASGWSANSDGHWHACIAGYDGCTEISGYDSHDWNDSYPCSCSTCGYIIDHSHTGGTATCSSQATCELCGTRYGDIDSANHTTRNHIFIDADAHSITCDCGATLVEREAHAFMDWTDDGNGGLTRYCVDCAYNEYKTTHTHSWVWTYDSSTHWQKCSDPDCGESSTAAQMHLFDDESDAACDTCGYTREVHQHSYSAATCIAPATCSCGATQGDADKGNHTGGTEIRDAKDAAEFEAGYTGDTYCLGCGEKLQSGSAIQPTHTHSWAWTYDDTTHWQKCGCGESKTSSQMHQFDNIDDITCDICGYINKQHLHSYDSHQFDAEGHWKVCACGESTAAEAHAFDNDIDESCDCGYVRKVENNLSIIGSMPAATVGQAYSTAFSYTGTVSGVVFWNATGLPEGLSMNYGTGIVSGTPAAEGSYKVTVSFGATGGGSVSMEFTLIVQAAPHEHSFAGEADDAHHWEACACGETRNEAAHSFAWETDDAHHWEACACGKTRGEAEHSYSAAHDSARHWEACACGKTRSEAEHSFGWEADDTHHWGACACGEVRNEEEHSYTTAHDSTRHWKECACGKTQNSAKHSYSTRYNANKHWKECACGATKDKTDHKWYVDNQTDSHHYLSCACGASERSAHQNTDNDKLSTCDICGHHVHAWSSWAPVSDSGYNTVHYSCCIIDSCSGRNEEDCYDGSDADMLCDACGSNFHRHDYKIVSRGEHGHLPVCACGDELLVEMKGHEVSRTYRMDWDSEKHWLLTECIVCGGQILVEGPNSHIITGYEYAGNPGYHNGFCEERCVFQLKHTWTVVEGHTIQCVDCELISRGEHVFERWLPSAYNPDKYHVKTCIACNVMDTEVKAAAHTNMEIRFDKDGHWQVCLDCGYATEALAHSELEIIPVQSRSLYHDAACADCDYVERQNCTFNTYAGNSDGHWLICDSCAKVQSSGVVRNHVDADGNAACDLCGAEIHSHSYHWQDDGLDYHIGRCACGAEAIGAHTDDDEDRKCDVCRVNVKRSEQGNHWMAAYSPADESADSGKMVIAEYSITGSDVQRIFSGAGIKGHAVVFPDDTALGGADFSAGKLYAFQPVFEQDIHVENANGVVTLIAQGASRFGENTQYLGAHLLADGTVQLAEAVCSGDTLTTKMHVIEASPFIILAVSEVTTHQVVRGDTLHAIADEYGCSIEEIIALNGDLIANPSRILPGWKLNVPMK